MASFPSNSVVAFNTRLNAALEKDDPAGVFNAVAGTKMEWNDLSVLLEEWNSKEENTECHTVAKYSIYLAVIKSIEQLHLASLIHYLNQQISFQMSLRKQFQIVGEFKHLLTVPNRMCVKFDGFQEALYKEAQKIGDRISDETLQKIYTAAWQQVAQMGIFNPHQLSLVIPDIAFPDHVVISGGGLKPYFRDFAWRALCDGCIKGFPSPIISEIAFPPIRINGAQLAYLTHVLDGKEVKTIYLALDDLSFIGNHVSLPLDVPLDKAIETLVRKCKITSCHLANLPDSHVQTLQNTLKSLGCSLTRVNK